MNPVRLTSLRDRLLLLVLLAMLPALGLTLYTNLEERRLAAADVQAGALRLTRLAAGNYQQLIDGMRQLLVTLARLPEARGDAPAACGARFADLLKHYPFYANVGVAGPDGGIVCSAVPLTEPVSAADREWFERAVRTREFAVGEYEIDRSRTRSLLVGAHPVPYPNGGTQAVIFAALDLGWLNQLAGTMRLPDGWAIAITDANGVVVARYPDPARSIGQPLPEATVIKAIFAAKGEGSAEVAGVDGVERFYAFTPLRGPAPGRGAYVSVSIPRHVASAEANRILRRNLAWLGIVAVLTLLAAWFGGDLVILRRMNALVTATRQLSAGDLRARAEVRGSDEVGTMAHAFNAMADRLAAMVAAEQQAKQALAERVNDLVAQRTHEVALLTRMSDLLQACFTPEEAYTVIGQLVGQFFPDEAGAIFVIGPPRDLVRAIATWGPSQARERQVFALDECWALRRGRVYGVDDTRAGLLCQHLPSPPPSAYVCVPLVAQGEALGVLHVSTVAHGDPDAAPSRLGAGGEGGPGGGGAERSEPPLPPVGGEGGLGAGGASRLTEARRRLAVTLAEQFALALANLKLREILKIQSIRDPLTGLFNRRYMEETLERELRRAERARSSVAVIMLDIDRFKRFNDGFGHEGGDAVLEELGSLLRSNSRAGDVACRFGGEEFVLIWPDASLPDARKRADELRESMKRLRVTHRGQSLGPVRCSMGVSAYPDHGSATDVLLRAADAALYRAKHQGRDQVLVAETEKS